MTDTHENDSAPRYWCLENFSLAEVLSQEEQDELHRYMQHQTYRAKEIIFSMGDPSTTVYKLHAGRVRLARLFERGRSLTLAILGPGQIFGETSLTDEAAQRWVAEALEESVVCSIQKQDLLRFAERNPKLSFRIFKILGDRLVEIDVKLEDLVFRSVRGRLAHTLLRIANRFGARGANEDETTLLFRLTHQDLAELIGSTRETTSAAMADLRRRRLINLKEGRVVLRNPRALSGLT